MILTSLNLNNEAVCGRLGNQMFIIASIYGIAKDTGSDFNIPWNYLERFGSPPINPSGKVSKHELIRYREQCHDIDHGIYDHVNNYKHHDGYLSIDGFLQDYRYFHEYEDEVVKLFKKDSKFDAKVCSIHVRRGDYLKYPDHHPSQSMSYYNGAISIIENRTKVKRFKVFSDDIKWCKENFIGDKFEFSEGNDPIEDLFEMAECGHNIIANSSFSWWGGYLNRNPKKIVISPERWFGPRATNCQMEGYKVPEWINIRMVNEDDMPKIKTFKGEMIKDLVEDKRWDLADELYAKNYTNKPKNPKDRIPKKIHQVWIGGEFPAHYIPQAERLKELHPDWEYKLWTDDDVEEFGLKNKKLFDKVANFGAKSDIFRYEILERLGGIYLDCDFVAVKPFDDFLYLDMFTGTGHIKKPEIFNGLIGTVPNHKIISGIVDDLLTKESTVKTINDVMQTTGPYFFTNSFFKRANAKDNVLILPTNFFYPLPAKYRNDITDQIVNQHITEDTYLVHLWDCSWQKK